MISLPRLSSLRQTPKNGQHDPSTLRDSEHVHIQDKMLHSLLTASNSMHGHMLVDVYKTIVLVSYTDLRVITVPSNFHKLLDRV